MAVKLLTQMTQSKWSADEKGKDVRMKKSAWSKSENYEKRRNVSVNPGSAMSSTTLTKKAMKTTKQTV